MKTATRVIRSLELCSKCGVISECVKVRRTEDMGFCGEVKLRAFQCLDTEACHARYSDRRETARQRDWDQFVKDVFGPSK